MRVSVCACTRVLPQETWEESPKLKAATASCPSGPLCQEHSRPRRSPCSRMGGSDRQGCCTVTRAGRARLSLSWPMDAVLGAPCPVLAVNGTCCDHKGKRAWEPGPQTPGMGIGLTPHPPPPNLGQDAQQRWGGGRGRGGRGSVKASGSAVEMGSLVFPTTLLAGSFPRNRDQLCWRTCAWLEET